MLEELLEILIVLPFSRADIGDYLCC